VDSTVDFLSSALPRKEAKKLSTDLVYQNIMSNIMANMLTRRSMERLRNISSGLVDVDVKENDEIIPPLDHSSDSVE
jgi:hypothetical protein